MAVLRWLACAIFVGLVAWAGWAGWQVYRTPKPGADLTPEQLATVRRGDLDVTLRAGGEINSARNTLIECQLESFSIRSEGRTAESDGTTMVLTVLPQGTLVKAGDVLCTLDASAYEEMHRQQTIKVESARTDRLGALMDLEAAKIEKDEYLKGTVRASREQNRGQQALAEADLTRARDRRDWTKRMLQKGYASKAQATTEAMNVLKEEHDLRLVVGEAQLFEKWTLPKATKQLDTSISICEIELQDETERLAMHEDRLKRLGIQIGHCTVKAPHDGMVLYAEEDDDDRMIAAGVRIRPQQDLFYLPDTSQMEVITRINESMISRVAEGMPAVVRVEARPGSLYHGEVVEIDSFPAFSEEKRRGSSVNNYIAHVRIAGNPTELRPGMTAEVEILADRCEDTLMIPTAALWEEQGQQMCYVTGTEGLEIRPVRIGRETSEWTEVVFGLDEGEAIVADSEAVDRESLPVEVAATEPQFDPTPSEPAPAAAGDDVIGR